MIYVLIGIFMALVFALCFLTDKLLQRLSKRADLGIGQSKVRLARANVIFGVILAVAGVALLLFFAARPGRWKYDFVSVLVCLGLIAVCMCLSFLPMVWSEIDPARGQNEMKLSKAYTTQVYEALRKENPDLRLRDVYTNLYLYANSVDDLQELQPSDGHLSLCAGLPQRGRYGAGWHPAAG